MPLSRRVSAVVAVIVLAGACASRSHPSPGPPPPTTVTPPSVVDPSAPGTVHLEYVVLDGTVVVHDIDAGHHEVDRIPLEQTRAGVRGVAAHPGTSALYISYGGDGGANGKGSVLRYDLVAKHVVWDRHYDHGIDSLAVAPDGGRLYVPDGELASDGRWFVVDAATGAEVGAVEGGRGAHNTVASPDGRSVYLGGRDASYLDVLDVATGRVRHTAGPLRGGVRPFVVDRAQTFAFTTATGVIGFQVSDLRTTRVLFTVDVPGFSWDPKRFKASAPSHGISLSPDGREVYLIDAPNSTVHVFDVSGLPATAPRRVADIRLEHAMTGEESPCAYDCLRDGWLQHTTDGRFVYVGDSGDVIDTASRRIVSFLPALANTRKMIEIDWRAGVPVSTRGR